MPPAWIAPGQPRARKVWPWVAAGVALLLVVAAVVISLLSNAATVTVRGDVFGQGAPESIYDASGFYPVEGQCSGHGDFSDIRAGAVVTVFDSDGQTVGTTQLGNGSGGYGACLFGFEVPDLAASDFYRVQVSGRPPVTWTLDEVMGQNGIRLTIGS